MSGEFWITNSDHSLKCFQQEAAKKYHQKKWVKWVPSYTKRSLDANALSHVWYAEIAKQTCEDTIDGVKAFCKLTFGVPILRRREKFNNFYSKLFVSLPYEHQLAAMKYLSITSIMDREEMRLYMENVKNHYELKGVILSDEKLSA